MMKMYQFEPLNIDHVLLTNFLLVIVHAVNEKFTEIYLAHFTFRSEAMFLPMKRFKHLGAET